jgi:hypothetical protein
MLQLMEYCVQHGEAASNAAWLASIGTQRGTAGKVRAGTHSFTKEQIYAAGSLYRVDMNWLFGFSDNMKRKNEKIDPLENLEEAVAMVGEIIKQKQKK